MILDVHSMDDHSNDHYSNHHVEGFIQMDDQIFILHLVALMKRAMRRANKIQLNGKYITVMRARSTIKKVFILSSYKGLNVEVIQLMLYTIVRVIDSLLKGIRALVITFELPI
jgi:hypothetical protein